jgi:hypothetical protein
MLLDWIYGGCLNDLALALSNKLERECQCTEASFAAIPPLVNFKKLKGSIFVNLKIDFEVAQC